MLSRQKGVSVLDAVRKARKPLRRATPETGSQNQPAKNKAYEKRNSQRLERPFGDVVLQLLADAGSVEIVFVFQDAVLVAVAARHIALPALGDNGAVAPPFLPAKN